MQTEYKILKSRISHLTATYQKSFAFDGQYGTTYFHLFQDVNGNKIKWLSATCLDDLTEGQTVTLSGTIKSHETYRDTKQTFVTRCKVASV